MTSKVILTNVQVLAAGTKIDNTTDKDKPMPVSVVTLLVNPDEAERLTLAASEGKIQLALRNPLDRSAPADPRRAPGRAARKRTCHARRAVTARCCHRRTRPSGGSAAARRSKSSAETNARTKSCASRSH